MKKFLAIIFLAVSLTACKEEGFSKEDKAIIQPMLELHNLNAATAAKVELSHLKTDEEIRWAGYKDKAKANAAIEQKVIFFKETWNVPYDIDKDSSLTMESYLDYCKLNQKDPKTFYKDL